MKITRVLCPVDFSDCSRRALQYAGAMAAWYEAELHVVHCFLGLVPTTLPVDTVIKPDREGVREATRTALRDFVHESGVTMASRQAIYDAMPVDGILEYADTINADLIVLGTHGRRALARAFIGSTAERVIHLAKRPVLTVPPATAEPGSPEVIRFRHILCPVDFSPGSAAALTLALSLAQENAATLTLLHVIELDQEDVDALADFNVGQLVQRRRQDACDRLRALVPADARAWCDVAERVEFGSPARTILRVAQHGPADVIVMGAQGRGGVGLALFGSNTQTIVRRATCPVLTAHAKAT